MPRTRTHPALATPPARTDGREIPRAPADVGTEVAKVLAGMTYDERVRAYRSGALSAHELAVAAAWFPDEMPLLNGEYEWIGCSLADNE